MSLNEISTQFKVIKRNIELQEEENGDDVECDELKEI